MFYVKNVPAWERALRVISGIAMLVCAWLASQGLIGGFVLGYVVAGVIALLTGFIGFCPMCAMVGRKINTHKAD